MVNIAAYRRIYELIARQISFGLNPAEEEELECWLKESEENRLLHSRLTDPHYLIRQEEKRNSVDVEKHWRIVRNRLTESKSIRAYPVGIGNMQQLSCCYWEEECWDGLCSGKKMFLLM